MKLTALWIGSVILATSLVGCVQKPAPIAPPPAGVEQFEKIAPEDELARRIAKDPVAVLQEGLDRYNRQVTSYTCTLYKQERVNPKGPMGPRQKLVCKFMDQPFSVCTDTVENPLGAKKALYVEGQWGNRMLVQPAGLGALLGFLLVEPRSAQARAVTLRFIDQFGFKRSVENMISSYQAARREALLTSKLLGTATLDGRSVIVYEARIAEPKPTGRFEFPHVRVYLDRQWLLPIAVDTWDAQGVQRGHYRYADVNFDANLSAKDFLPETNGMRLPKPTTAATQKTGK
ncbi:MAG: DUF1571 domain-containing protein [Phycisphaerae bacterium]|jgi:hypothetical protein